MIFPSIPDGKGLLIAKTCPAGRRGSSYASLPIP